ncbi:TIGR04282 family arsenosugar biosynthesis glycosyltransferase [Desulfomarina sp.]
MTTCNHLILFTRFPRPATTKTRLAPLLGDKGAAELQRTMTEQTVAEMVQLRKEFPVTLSICYDDAQQSEMKKWLGEDFIFHPQVPGDLGLKMARAFSALSGTGCKRAVLVGSDIPEINKEILQQGFAVLEEHDVVFGPVTDGGYYLIGLRTASLEYLGKLLFSDIPWSTENVLKLSLERMRQHGYSVFLLPVLQDIDRPEDVLRARRKGLL